MAVNLTDEQFRQMMAAIGVANTPKGSFSKCTARYSGSRQENKIDEFITTIEIYKDIERIPDGDALKGFPLLLEDAAATWWQALKTEAKTFKEATTLLRKHFAPARPNYITWSKICENRQKKDEPTDTFVTKQRALFNTIPEPKPPVAMQIDILFSQLLPHIKHHIRREEVNSFNDLLSQARTLELQELEKNAPTTPVTEVSTRTGQIRCSYCKKRGHGEKDCRKKGAVLQQTDNTKPGQSTDTITKISCYGCGKPDVYRSKCPTCNEKQKRSPRTVEFYYSNEKLGNGIPTVDVEICGKPGRAHFDTGARTSIASQELYQCMKTRGCKFTRTQANIYLADGTSKEHQILLTTVPIKLGERRMYIRFTVLENSTNNRTLIGNDFMENAKIMFNIAQRAWCFSDNPATWFTYDLTESMPNELPRGVQRQQPRKECYGIEPLQTPTIVETKPLFRRFAENIPLLSPMEATPKRKKRKSTTDEEIQQMIDEFKQIVPISPLAATPSPKKRMNINIMSIQLTVAQHKTVENFKTEMAHVFADSGEATNLAVHYIKLKKDMPVATRPYRLSEQKRAELQKEINEMLKNNIIESSNSPWAAPVVMIPKKTGGHRVCIDYRKLNANTIPDHYPLPRIDDLLHEAKSSKYMSTIDLCSGYWQVKMNEDDILKTAFVTPFGSYQFKRMPFGLVNAPATFQRMIDRFKTSLPHIAVLAYLDDIIIRSNTFDQHMQDLKDVFKTLGKHHLRVNEAKCKFCCSEIKYLGHIITQEGIVTDPEKMEAIRKREPPRNVKQLLSFIQTCSWYRRFIENFAKTMQPLTKLTRKDEVWHWGEKQHEAFETMKKRLSTAPVLKQVNIDLPFILKTDASGYAIGAVLLQGEGADEHPVEYASRLLTPAEVNYATIEREALAVVWAVNKFRGYIESTNVTIITDHQPLKWLMSIKSPSGRLARWALQLQQYNLSIDYAPGRTNIIADTLSRPPCRAEQHQEHCTICTLQIDIPHRDAKEIRNAQLDDPKLKQIINTMESTEESEQRKRYSDIGYLLNKGILYRYIPDEDYDDAQLVIPEDEQIKIIKSYHNEATAGHNGITGTIARITPRYFWSGMRKMITDYVKKCPECQKYKTSNLKPAGLIQSTAARQRFEVIAIDFFGPLPATQEGFQHILIIEDVASRWVELFPLKQATASNCADIILNEIILRFGTPRRIISDNGTQFISAIMQKLTFCLGISQEFKPRYHPESNPVERKNRDLKTQLAMVVGTNHPSWIKNIAAVRFAMNTLKCSSTGYSAAFLTFGRELRTPDDVNHDVRQIISNENFIPEITPKLLGLIDTLRAAQETTAKIQEKNQNFTDQKRREDPGFTTGDKVWIKAHALSKAANHFTAKFAPKRDGPYVILQKIGPASYEVGDKDGNIIGTYHTSSINKCSITDDIEPVLSKRRRGRPKKN